MESTPTALTCHFPGSHYPSHDYHYRDRDINIDDVLQEEMMAMINNQETIIVFEYTIYVL